MQENTEDEEMNEIKKTYITGYFYEEYNNLLRVELEPPSENPIGDKTIAIYRYTDRFYNSTLRFKREKGEKGCEVY